MTSNGKTCEIIITNILATGTAFAVIADDTRESVFIPPRVSYAAHIKVGDRVNAQLIDNVARPDKTRWFAAMVERPVRSERDDELHAELRARILDDIDENGPATTEELAQNIHVREEYIRTCLIGLASDGSLVRGDIWAREVADLISE